MLGGAQKRLDVSGTVSLLATRGRMQRENGKFDRAGGSQGGGGRACRFSWIDPGIGVEVFAVDAIVMEGEPFG